MTRKALAPRAADHTQKMDMSQQNQGESVANEEHQLHFEFAWGDAAATVREQITDADLAATAEPILQAFETAQRYLTSAHTTNAQLTRELAAERNTREQLEREVRRLRQMLKQEILDGDRVFEELKEERRKQRALERLLDAGGIVAALGGNPLHPLVSYRQTCNEINDIARQSSKQLTELTEQFAAIEKLLQKMPAAAAVPGPAPVRTSTPDTHATASPANYVAVLEWRYELSKAVSTKLPPLLAASLAANLDTTMPSHVMRQLAREKQDWTTGKEGAKPTELSSEEGNYFMCFVFVAVFSGIAMWAYMKKEECEEKLKVKDVWLEHYKAMAKAR
ncbi:hypothetical protein BDV95DRAFT_622027 [Massariosphaeria phaeospora]|uniref:Uncharacterized protein n=1 Tax=Massariosphaeria phaeospora TaxID=100035 RepID=A0A7C8M753_9PLEO|nr:hypothetical protein BDV95DRAFT_622027 [Massariosphaeria phaeospora]